MGSEVLKRIKEHRLGEKRGHIPCDLFTYIRVRMRLRPETSYKLPTPESLCLRNSLTKIDSREKKQQPLIQHSWWQWRSQPYNIIWKLIIAGDSTPSINLRDNQKAFSNPYNLNSHHPRIFFFKMGYNQQFNFLGIKSTYNSQLFNLTPWFWMWLCPFWANWYVWNIEKLP